MKRTKNIYYIFNGGDLFVGERKGKERMEGGELKKIIEAEDE